MERLIALYDTWQAIKPAAFSVGLLTKFPVDQASAMKGLTRLEKEFPELDQSRFDDDKREFVLETLEPDSKRKVLLRMVRYSDFELAWGPDAGIEFPGYAERFFAALEEGFELESVNVDLVDVTFTVKCDWSGRHYQAIFEAFLGNSPLGSLCTADKMLQDDLWLRVIVDSERVASIKIESDVTDAEVLSGRFGDDRLTARVGVAQVRGLAQDGNLCALFRKHASAALDFMSERFVPAVVMPLDKAVTRLTGSEA